MNNRMPRRQTESQRAEDQRIREAETLETERQEARRFIERTAKAKRWPDQELHDVLLALGLEEPDFVRTTRVNGRSVRIPRSSTVEQES